MTSEDREDIKRHVSVLIEGLRSETQLVAEGVAMTNQRLERLEGNVEALGAETARNSTEFRAETAHNFADARAEVAGTFSDVDRRLRAVENR